jgi:hypothetical protein
MNSKKECDKSSSINKSLMLTGVVDAYEGQNVMTTNIPNTQIQAKIPEVKPGMIVKITRVINI